MKRPLRWLLHALELDHSPSLSIIGRCPCKSCPKFDLGTVIRMSLDGRRTVSEPKP